MPHELKNDALEFIRDNPVCHMATVEDNRPSGRVMWTVKVDDDFSLWYASPTSSHKMKQLEKNPAVCITVHGGQKDARILGRASVVNDRELKNRMWKDEWKTYFPRGKEDPEYQLIRVEAESLEYRDWKNLGMKTAKIL